MAREVSCNVLVTSKGQATHWMNRTSMYMYICKYKYIPHVYVHECVCE